MTKLNLENYFSTSLINSVDDSIVGEIEFQLPIEPNSDFGYLILDYETDNREEIFYHRKAGSSVFVYGINRVNPKEHDINASVQMNDSASIFNYITNLLPDHFFMYKTGADTMYIRGGKIYEKGTYTIIPNKTDLSFAVGTNYLYIEEGVILSTTASLTDKYIFGDVITDGAGDITDFNNYNTIALVTDRTNKIIRGSGSPSAGTGIDGDYYIDDTDKDMYGPKASGSWGAGFSIQGIQGIKGDQGEVGPAGSITEAAEEEEQTANDNQLIEGGSTIDLSVGVYIKIIGTDGSYVKYTTSDITTVDANGNQVGEVTGLTGAWDGNNIEYTGYAILIVNGDTGTLTFNGKFAYTNIHNKFNEANTFNEVSIFEGQVIFPPYWSGAINGTNVDMNEGTKHYVDWNTSNTLTMSNIKQGATVLLALDNKHATDPITLTLGNFNGIDGAGSPKTFDKYDIGENGYPFELSVGIHMFVIEMFNEGAHISYAGKSVAL